MNNKARNGYLSAGATTVLLVIAALSIIKLVWSIAKFFYSSDKTNSRFDGTMLDPDEWAKRLK